MADEVVRGAAVAADDGSTAQPLEPSTGPLLTELGRAQREHDDLKRLFEFKASLGEAPPADSVIHCSPTVKAYLMLWPFIEIHDGIMNRRKPGVEADASDSTLQILLPFGLRNHFLKQIHAGFGGGHLGIRRTVDAVRKRAYWIGWGADTRRYCQHCNECARYHRGAAPKQGPLQNMKTGGLWERLGIDVTGPHPRSSKGYVYILTVIDYFSKWADAFPMRNQEASTIARLLVDRVIAYYGAPVQILTDQGANFQSRLFTELLKCLQIDYMRTSPYKPSTNG